MMTSPEGGDVFPGAVMVGYSQSENNNCLSVAVEPQLSKKRFRRFTGWCRYVNI
jgi:hypothetical protein